MQPPAAPAPPSAPAAAAPFSAGGVIGRSLSTWFANLVPFSIVTLAVHSPVIVLAALAPPEGGSGWNALDAVLSALAGFVATGALTYGVLESLRGGRAPIAALLGTGFRQLGAVFVTSLRVGLWMVLGVLLLVVPAVVWYCALYVAVPAIVAEPKLGSSADALERSRALTKGSRWAIFVVAIVMGVVSVVAAGLAGLVAAAVQFLPHPVPAVFSTAVIAVVSGLGACASAVAYHDLRVAKEGVATADLVKVFE